MTNLVTIVTPCAEYHTNLLPRCKASVQAQTVECAHIVIQDDAGRGAGWARNRGLELVQTPFVTFLDCDDWIEPGFIEQCLTFYDGARYVFTDWHEGDAVKFAPECLIVNRNWHCITTLLPTNWARAIGGFDENLPFAEDTYFYLKLSSLGMCGKRYPHPLFHYGHEGQRSKRYLNTPDIGKMTAFLAQEFGATMGDCGTCGGGTNPNLPEQAAPVGEPQAGDVLVQPLWSAGYRIHGRATGRLYPRANFTQLLWVNERDVIAMPDKFRRVDTAPLVAPDAPPRVNLQTKPLNGAEGVAAYMMDAHPAQVESVSLPEPVKVDKAPNVSKVVAKAKRGKR